MMMMMMMIQLCSEVGKFWFLPTAKKMSSTAETEMSLEQQENLQIKGSQARSIMMQKLLRNVITLSAAR